MDKITMSKKEVDRIPVLKKLCRGDITAKEAAETLDLSTRHTRRLKKRFKQKGVKGLIHRSTGSKSNNKIDEQKITKVISIIKKRYHDFGPTLAYEKLEENEGISFSVETLRKAMIEEGIWKAKRQRKVYIHQQRPRRKRRGELIQMDASPHRWFEDRAKKCDLLIAIDDATGQIVSALFSKGETTNAYFVLMKNYLTKHGKPLSLYVDKNSIFQASNNKVSLTNPTQFKRAMNELNIELILANSPQAKGRVERVNSTLQDRLVKQMRLKGISSIKDGNNYLPEFIKKFNKKFAVEPEDKKDAHRPLLQSQKLDKIFVKRYQRVLSKNLELQFEGVLYQIRTTRPRYAMRRAAVVVTKDIKDKVRIHYKGKEIKYKKVDKRQKANIASAKQINDKVDKLRATTKARKPSKDHPWRHMSI